MQSSRILGAVALAGLVLGAGQAFAADQKFVSIGTGGVTGVYYPTGGAICRLVNKGRKQHGIRCSAESTGGSIYNINTIRASGELEFGVAQSDWQYHAYNGTSKFKDAGAFKKLRAVFSVHPEPVTIVARPMPASRTSPTSRASAVNIGNPGSGTLGTWDVIEQGDGLEARGPQACRPDEVGGNRTGAVRRQDRRLLLAGRPPVGADAGIARKLRHAQAGQRHRRRRLTSWSPTTPTTGQATIPAGMYNNKEDDQRRSASARPSSLRADSAGEVVYTVVKAVFDNFDQFKKLHPAFAHLKAEQMIKDSLSAPLHDGRRRSTTSRKRLDEIIRSRFSGGRPVRPPRRLFALRANREGTSSLPPS